MPTCSRRSFASASSFSRVISCPSSETLPEVARSRPASTINRLVLPDPDGPMRPTASPLAISRSTPRSMLTGPAADGTVRMRFLTRTSGWAGGREMASIGRVYWHRGWRRKAQRGAMYMAFALTVTSTVPAWATAPRLLVLGDSLSAGYGLAHDQGFEVQLQQALKAAGHNVSIVDGAVSGDTSAGGR